MGGKIKTMETKKKIRTFYLSDEGKEALEVLRERTKPGYQFNLSAFISSKLIEAANKK